MKTIFLNKILLLFTAILLVSTAEIQAQTFDYTGDIRLGQRLKVQGVMNSASSWQRGLISQNIYFKTEGSVNEWVVEGSTYNDFSMIKFNNGGHIGFYTRPRNASGNYQLTNSALESYNRMTILNNGDVGIGRNPSQKLDVAGHIRLGNTGFGYLENTTGYIGIRPTDATHGFIMRDYTGNSLAWSGIRHVTDDVDRLEFAVMGGGNYGQSLVLTQDNKVGIGAIPTNHELEVNGTIRAKEIIVEEGWGDYVFYDDYQLPTLEEEEIHIEENGHLLGFESEEDMAGEIQLGDVAKRQQVKIEEVVLHLIELKKEVEQLKKDNGQLKKDNEQLKKQMAEK